MSFLDFLFPRSCFGCGKNGTYLCQRCISLLPIVKQKCIVCEKPAIDGYTHAKCRSKYTIDRTISIWEYQGSIRKAILSLKYKFASDIANELAKRSSNALFKIDQSLFKNNAILVPIPLYWKRKNWRGFNQTEELGKSIGKLLQLQYLGNLLIRTQQKKVQAHLSAKERKENIEGVFTLNTQTQTLNGKKLILFDDVYTTGETLKEAGRVLKRGGAKEVWALTIAR